MSTREPEASPMELVRALRSRAMNFSVIADALGDSDESVSAVAREEAVRLRCHAAALEELSELYDELGQQVLRWDEFTVTLRGTSTAWIP